MNRRGFVGIASVLALSGCTDTSEITDVADQSLGNNQSLGDTVTFGEIDVTITEILTAGEVTTYVDTMGGKNRTTHTAPSNGKFVLFFVECYNPDITDRQGPGVNTADYEQMTVDDDAIAASSNDIRVYGGSEGGHLPEKIERSTYDGILVGGGELESYPVTPGGIDPKISADGTVTGWTFGLIPRDKTPRLKVEFNGNSATWEEDSEDS